MRQYPESNNITEIKKAFRAVYRLISCIRANEFEFLYGTGDPVEEPSSQKSIYINTDDNGLWEWQTSAWVFITYLGGGGIQNLQEVLDEGNSAVDQNIQLFGDDSYINVYATDNTVTASFGVDTEPRILLTNSLGYKITLRAALVSGNTVEFPANSGTLALLSDIPPATPTVISTKTTTYTLQLADADFDTLFEMDAATDEDFIVDSAVAFPIGTSFIFARRGAGEVNIVAAGATVILSANGATNLTYQDSGATLIKVSATEWYLFGDIGLPITAVPGGNDRELQFNDGGVAFGGATGFTYDPANTYGLVELVSTDDTKSLFSIQGPSTSANIFEVADENNPGVGNYFIVGANTGYMAGVWTISNGGELNIATGSLGLQNMLKLTNAAGVRTMALSLSDDNTFAIRDTVAAVNRIEISPTGDIAIKALDTDSAAPSTTGTVKMVTTDGTGKLSFQAIPAPAIPITALPEKIFYVDLDIDSTKYPITEEGLWSFEKVSNLPAVDRTIQFPDPEAFIGASITVYAIDNEDLVINNDNGFAPVDDNTVISTITATRTFTFKAMYTSGGIVKWLWVATA